MARGIKTGGGSRKGRPNKVTAARKAAIASSGLLPLDYLLSVMRNKRLPPERRDDAAKAAAQFCHPRLQAIEHKGPDDKPIQLDVLLSPREAHMRMLKRGE
jgi:hypothetical protein